MGCHTWFYKTSEMLDRYDSLDNDEFLPIEIENELDELFQNNETDYHDLFRTASKELRYNDFILRSKKETLEFIEKYKDQLEIFDYTFEYLNKFWDEYPNGAIDFG